MLHESEHAAYGPAGISSLAELLGVGCEISAGMPPDNLVELHGELPAGGIDPDNAKDNAAHVKTMNYME